MFGDVDFPQELRRNFLQLESTQGLLRYVSECNPMGKGTTKGGYMKGRVDVPFNGKKIWMRMDLVPSELVIEMIKKEHPDLSFKSVMTYPGLLHNFRFKNGKRAANIEPALFNHSWKLDFLIDPMRNINILIKECMLDANRLNVSNDSEKDDSKVGTLQQGTNDQYFFILKKQEDKKKTRTKNQRQRQKTDEDEILIKPLQLKQKGRSGSNPNQPNITDVIADRLSEETWQVRTIIESFYKNEYKIKNARNLKMFRLRVQFRDSNDFLIGWDISDDIKDTGNKNSGALDILDVFNQKSCCSGGRKINVTSEWTLDVKEVLPKLQVYDEEGNHIEEESDMLIQPNETFVRSLSVSFLSPSQKLNTIREIEERGHKMKLLLYRTTDGYESPKKICFQYIPCHDQCDYCVKKVDGDSSGKLEKGKRPAVPGETRRKMHNSKKLKMETNIRKSTESDSGISDASGNISPLHQDPAVVGNAGFFSTQTQPFPNLPVEVVENFFMTLLPENQNIETDCIKKEIIEETNEKGHSEEPPEEPEKPDLNEYLEPKPEKKTDKCGMLVLVLVLVLVKMAIPRLSYPTVLVGVWSLVLAKLYYDII